LVNHSDLGRVHRLPYLAATISNARPIFFMKSTQVSRYASTRLWHNTLNQIDWLTSPQEVIKMNAGKKFRKTLVSLSVLSALLLSVLMVSPAAAATSPLMADEIAGLKFMREEEKLAHDVYVTFYQQYGLAIFNNIANSEATHMTAVKTLLDRYGIADPAAGNGIGEFENAELQALYNQLMAQGRQSLSAALQVSAAIEEIDILDLKELLAMTARSDIEQVYTSLLNGSHNHLRAFANTLKMQTGEVYQPQYLDAGTYQTVIAGTNGRRGGSGGSSNAIGGGNSRGGRRW
jgi:hypothetical protein